MSTTPATYFNSTDSSVTHSKENALDDREFEQLYEGASRLEEYWRIQCQFVILMLGRLGLRRGELSHLRVDWVDPRKQIIRIPSHEPCLKGRDGDHCGYCKQLAAQTADCNDGVTYEDALRSRWHPKTEAAVRDVYYGWSPRCELAIDRFLDRFGDYEWSAQSTNRRVDRALEAADELAVSSTNPHGLRATAASHHAGRGLKMPALMQHFGWSKSSTAECYVSRSPENTARQLDAIHIR